MPRESIAERCPAVLEPGVKASSVFLRVSDRGPFGYCVSGFPATLMLISLGEGPGTRHRRPIGCLNEGKSIPRG